VLIDLVPIMLGAALVPIPVIIVVLLLRSDSGLTKALAFLSGAVVVRLAQGALFGQISLERAAGDGGENGSQPVLSTLLLVIGILMLITAVRKLLRDEDPDAPPPRWMTLFATASPARTLGLGALLMIISAKQWVFTLGAISTIRDGGLARSEGIQAYLLYVLGANAVVLLPVLFRIVMPSRSDALLDAVGQWLERNSSVIAVVVSAIFGTYFLIKGITGLT
jgi:hypothetical protein